MSNDIYQYLTDVHTPEPEILQRLRADTASLYNAGMIIDYQQGLFMAWLMQLLGASRILEIGTFTGYSSLLMAMFTDAHIVTLDVNDDTMNIARQYWAEANVSDRILGIVGDATKTLAEIISSGQHCDVAFIDADKQNNLNYLEMIYPMVDKLIIIDNCLWHGQVANMTDADKRTTMIHEQNIAVIQKYAPNAHIIPLGDGMLAIHK